MERVGCVVLVALLAAAVITDIRHRKIANAVVLGGAALGLGLAALQGSQPFALAVGGGVVGVILLLPFYLARGMAAGDIKLMGMAGIFLGANGVLIAGMYSFAAGGVLAVLWLIFPTLGNHHVWSGAKVSDASPVICAVHLTSERSASVDPCAVEARRLPYAIAIATGCASYLIFG